MTDMATPEAFFGTPGALEIQHHAYELLATDSASWAEVAGPGFQAVLPDKDAPVFRAVLVDGGRGLIGCVTVVRTRDEDAANEMLERFDRPDGRADFTAFLAPPAGSGLVYARNQGNVCSGIPWARYFLLVEIAAADGSAPVFDERTREMAGHLLTLPRVNIPIIDWDAPVQPDPDPEPDPEPDLESGPAAAAGGTAGAEERGGTTNDAIDRAFADLRAERIVALQNAGMTQSDGWSDAEEEALILADEIADELAMNDEAESDEPDRFEPPAGSRWAPVRGAVFYHGQDVARARRGQGLYLTFGAFAERGRVRAEHDAASVRVGETVRDVLLRHGVAVEWDGTVHQRLFIPPFPWHGRR